MSAELSSNAISELPVLSFLTSTNEKILRIVTTKSTKTRHVLKSFIYRKT